MPEIDVNNPADQHAALVEQVKALSSPMSPIATACPERVPQLPGVRAVAFDVYGTLLISGTGDVGTAASADRPAALADALRDAGFVVRSTQAADAGVRSLADHIQRAHTRLRGRGLECPEVEIRDIWADVLADLRAQGLVEGEYDRERVERLAIAFECRVNPVWPMPHAVATLARLRASGRLLAIVSNAQFYTPLVIEATLGAAPAALGFADERCVWSYRLLEAKPSTALYERLAAHLEQREGVAPHEVLYVGNDIRNDIWPAQRVGFRTALFAGDQRSLRLREDDPACRGVQPDAVIHTLTRVTEMINR
jgi:putative hydrolase of the HAD superfamily